MTYPLGGRAVVSYTLVEYVGVRRRRIMRKSKERSVLELIRQAQQQHVLPSRQYWHELPMDMELDAAAFDDGVDRVIPGARDQANGPREGEARPLQ